MARILGLDLGSHSVKAVVFETTMRGYATKLVSAVRRSQEGDKAETLKAAITELYSRQPIEVDQVAIALPGPTLATHLITLPFNEVKKIEQALPFEIESQLPFDLSEVVFDYQVASAKEKKTDLLVSVVRKEDLTQLLATLKEVNVDPRIVTHPALTYQNLLSSVPAPAVEPGVEPQPVAIIDIGHERTSVAIGVPGGPVEFARTFSGGGRDLTRVLAAEFQVPFPEAELWKEAHGALASAVSGPDSERGAAALIRGMQGLLRELRQTLKSYTARSRHSISRIYLCGGTARLPGIEEQLQSDLGIPVGRLPLPAEVAPHVEASEQPTIAQAYALAMRGSATGSKAPRFNFRRGDFAFKGEFGFARGRIGRLAAFAATILLLLIASGVVRNTLLSRREAAVDAQLCEATTKVLGRCEKDYARALNMLQGTESPAAAVPKTSAVQLLADVTTLIPPDTKVTIDQLEVGLDRISIKATTDSTKQVDTVTAALKKDRCFKEVQQRKVERTRDGQKVNFGLEIQVECPADNGNENPQG